MKHLARPAGTSGMMVRATLIAAFVVMELVFIRQELSQGDTHATGATHVERALSRLGMGPNLVEDGPHRVFYVGARPAVEVDIGYADLTILTRNAPQIEVSLRGSSAFGILRATAPISARADGETVRISTAGESGWSTGDNRMVTIVVPADTRVTVVHGGDIRANGLRAEANLTSIGSGSITVEDYDAPALQVAARGKIVLRQVVSPRLDATSTDGHVEGTALQVRDGLIESDGRVTLGFSAGSDTTVSAQTGDGRVNLLGLVAAGTPGSARKTDDDDGASQSTRIGAGTGHLAVHASDGDITLAGG